MRRILNMLSSLAIAGFLGMIAWACVPGVPGPCGGKITTATTDGISMEPRFHTGDLALIVPACRYRVGDVVAYHNALLKSVVMHRLVRRYPDGTFESKGDNNSWVDSGRFEQKAIIGRLALRIPAGGQISAVFHDRRHTGLFLGVLTLMLVLAGGEESRGSRGSRRDLAGAHDRASAVQR